MEIFEKKTGVKVEFEKKSFEQIRQNAAQILNSDEAPDVMEYNKGNATAGLLASQGLLGNLNDYVKKYNWDKKVSGSLAATGKYNDKGVMGSGDWYGITNYGEDVVMYYNKDMFDKYGIEIPKTFDDLEAAMQKFVDNGVTPLSEGVAEYPLQHLWWQLVLSKANDKFIKNYEMYDGDVDWQGEATTYATKTIKDWVSKGYISKDCTGTKAEDAGQGFMNGTYPMFFSGTWWFGRFQSDMKNANLGLAASIQPQHAMDDRDVITRFWGNPAGIPYAFNSLHRAGIKLLMGSDAPVAPLDPWLAISAAVFGTESSDREPFQSEQCLDFETALASSTALGRTTLQAGDAADLVLLDCDPSALESPEAMRAMPDHVLATMLAGCWTYQSHVSRL